MTDRTIRRQAGVVERASQPLGRNGSDDRADRTLAGYAVSADHQLQHIDPADIGDEAG